MNNHKPYDIHGKGIWPLKRWIVFAYSQYYPCGGLADITTSFDSLERALLASEGKDSEVCVSNDNVYVIDRDTWEEVSR